MLVASCWLLNHSNGESTAILRLGAIQYLASCDKYPYEILFFEMYLLVSHQLG